MDFVLSGQHSPFYLAAAKGWYADNGLDVTVQEGAGSGPAVTLVGNKSIEFAFVDGLSLATAVGKGMPVKMVSRVFGQWGQGIMALPKTKLDNAKDLEGKTLGLSPGTSVMQLWPAFVANAKIDVSKVTIVNVTAQAKRQLLYTDKLDVMQGAQSDYVNVTADYKAEPKVLWFWDYGLGVMGYGIIAHNDMIKDKPDLVKGFVAATLKAYDYARQNPDEAIAAMVKAQPDVNRPTLKDELATWIKNCWDTVNTKGKPTGWMSDKDWQATEDIAEQYLGQPKTTIDNFYTNDFLPK